MPEHVELYERSTMLVVLPLQPSSRTDVPKRHDGAIDAAGPSRVSAFHDIDPDVDLPAGFFGALTRVRASDLDSELVVELRSHQSGPRRPDRRVAVEVLDCSTIGVGVDVVRSEFLVVRVRPRTLDGQDWLDAAKALSSVEASGPLVRLLEPSGRDRAPWSADTRPTVLLAAYVGGPQVDRESFAAHLATRAPLDQPLWRNDDLTGVTPLSDHHCWFVTPRITGFVIDADGRVSHFEQKFLEELDAQYLLAVVLTLWQRSWMERMLSQVQATWDDTEGRRGWERSKAVGRRLHQLRALRHQHAVLIASGTFGPAFDSGSQAMFWEAVQQRYAIQRRRDELDEALNALAGTAEIQASANLERLLGFFTLVVGVPSLVFAVLGVNINRVTSRNDGVSFLLVMALLVGCVLIGAGAFLLTSGWFSAGSGRTVRRVRRVADSVES